MVGHTGNLAAGVAVLAVLGLPVMAHGASPKMTGPGPVTSFVVRGDTVEIGQELGTIVTSEPASAEQFDAAAKESSSRGTLAAEPEDREQFRQIEETVQRHGAKLLPVFLHCSREEALRRVGNPDRVERRKTSSGEYLIRELDRYDLTAVPRPDCLKLDTSINPADATARKIAQHYGLDG